MNRQYRRLSQKQEAQRKTPQRPQPRQPGTQGTKTRTGPRQFGREVWAELRKVAWPNREEVTAYTLVVLVSVIFIAAVIWAFDWVFSKAIIQLYGIH